MITITPSKDGRVMRVGYADATLPKGAIEVAEIPSAPTLDEGKACELFWNGKALEWRIFDAPPMPEPEPEPTEPTEPQPPTRDEVEAMRQEAYRLRVDPITCEISRLRDMGGTEDEIAEAMERRAQEVARIKAELPYPEEVDQWMLR